MANSVLAKMAVEISANTAQFNKSLADTNKKLDSFSKGISTIGKSLVAGLGLYEIGNGIIDVTSKFQKFEAVLTNTLGNQSAAQKALRDIEAFAQNTPFQVDEVTAAYVRWANQGLDPTIDRMNKLGDIASSLGAGFEQTAEAFKDLLVGQTKRIEEVGISATQINGKIQLSFKGVNIEIEKNKEGVQKALDIYSQLNGVLGTSDAISKTLGGRISNLKDSWDLLLKTIGNANSGPLFTSINVLTRLTQGLAYAGIQAKITFKGLKSLSEIEFEKVFNFGETESLKKISDVIKEINDLNSGAFFKEIEANKKRFIELLSKEGESQETILILWQKYVDIRLKAGNAETDAFLAKKNTIDSIKEETKAVKELTEAQLLSMKAKDRANNVDIQSPTVAGFDTSKLSFKSANPLAFSGIENNDAIDSMKSAYDGLNESIKNLNKTQDENNQKIVEGQQAWLNFGQSASNIIAGIISSDRDLGASIKKTAASIIQQNAAVIASWLAAKFAKDSATKTPAVAIAALTVGLGVVAGLLGKDWKKGASASSSSTRDSFGNVTQGNVQFVLRGQDLYGSLSNFQRNNRFTTA